MSCIKSAQRAALTALAPDAPYLAAGTMSGAVDMSVSASANIEIFRLDFQSDSPDLPLLASAPSPDRFNRLSWSKPGAVEGDSFALGLLAGGLSDGSVAVWNPLSMISSEGTAEDAMVARLERHTGPVCGLEFSELTPNRLASGAEQGELCIWDLKNPAEPVVFPPLRSVGSSAQAEISCLSWNPKFQHILATTSSNGMTVVWDLRNQKPLTSFSDSNKRKCSVLQWNPDHSTELIVVSDDENSPSLRVWDVRKTISPVREFVGHSKGVIAMSWCPYDSSFLLTCSKDNRTICWDTISGEIISELPTSVNGNIDLHWCRKIPGVIAASSFDGKIGIYNLEFSGLYAVGDALGAPARPRAPAPKWLKCPTDASFGFGGKLVSFHPAATIQGVQASSSEVQLHNLVIEQSLVSRSTEFETAIQNGDKSSLRALCEKKLQESLSDEERESWGFLRVMFEDGDVARTKLIAHLGFEPPQAPTANSTDELSQTLADTLNLDHDTITDNTDAQFLVDNGDDFFNNPQSSEASLAEETISTNGQQIEHEMPADVVPSDPTVDKSIQHALVVVGDYKGAVNQCLAANRMADALVIAHAGGSALWESTRNHYLKNSISPYLKVVSAMVGNDLTSFISIWPLSSWKETLALLCTDKGHVGRMMTMTVSGAEAEACHRQVAVNMLHKMKDFNFCDKLNDICSKSLAEDCNPDTNLLRDDTLGVIEGLSSAILGAGRKRKRKNKGAERHRRHQPLQPPNCSRNGSQMVHPDLTEHRTQHTEPWVRLPDTIRRIKYGRRSRMDAKPWTCKECGSINMPVRHLIADLPPFQCLNRRCNAPLDEQYEFSFTMERALVNGFCPIGSVKDQLETCFCTLFGTCSALEITQRMANILKEDVPVGKNFEGPLLDEDDLLKKYETVIELHDVNTGYGQVKFNQTTLLAACDIATSEGISHVKESGVATPVLKSPGKRKVPKDFSVIARKLANGTPLISAINTGKWFDELKHGQIYKAPSDESCNRPGKKFGRHTIVLIGAGKRRNCLFYHFLNSHGVQFCIRLRKSKGISVKKKASIKIFHGGGRYGKAVKFPGGFGKVRASDLLWEPIEFLRYPDSSVSTDLWVPRRDLDAIHEDIDDDIITNIRLRPEWTRSADARTFI